jgi:hypothetical protein
MQATLGMEGCLSESMCVHITYVEWWRDGTAGERVERCGVPWKGYKMRRKGDTADSGVLGIGLSKDVWTYNSAQTCLKVSCFDASCSSMVLGVSEGPGIRDSRIQISMLNIEYSVYFMNYNRFVSRYLGDIQHSRPHASLMCDQSANGTTLSSREGESLLMHGC